MKVCLVSPYDFSHPGGVSAHVEHLAAELRGRNHMVTIMAPDTNLTDDHEIEGFVRIGRSVPIKANGSVARVALSFHLVRRVRALLASEAFDVVHYHEPLIPSLPITVLRFHKGANVGTFHAMAESNLGYYYGRPFLSRYAKRLDARIAVSLPARDFVNRYFPGEYEIIPNGVDVGRFSPTVESLPQLRTPGQTTILFLGRLEQRKGLDTLLSAYTRIRRYRSDIRLVIVGDGKMREGYEDRVHDDVIPDTLFVGRVSPEDLPRCYRSADIYCHPATGNESFGIVLLEAMASGCAVVASNIPGFAQVISPSIDGELVEPGDEEAWAKALITLANDGPRRESVAAAGRATALRYAWPRVTDQVEEVYERAIATSRSRQHEAMATTGGPHVYG